MPLEGQDWLRIIPAAGAISFAVYLVLSKLQGQGSALINKSIRKEEKKIADSFDVEDLGESTAFCRCWRSRKFPICDGSHNLFNMVTGDNVGPLCLNKKTAAS